MFKLTLDIYQVEQSGDGEEVIINVIQPEYVFQSEDLNEVTNERNRLLKSNNYE